MKAYWGAEVWIHAFLTSALDGGEWTVSRPGRFTPGNEPLVPYPPYGPQSWSGRGGEEKIPSLPPTEER
jgi:hypothetical protein